CNRLQAGRYRLQSSVVDEFVVGTVGVIDRDRRVPFVVPARLAGDVVFTPRHYQPRAPDRAKTPFPSPKSLMWHAFCRQAGGQCRSCPSPSSPIVRELFLPCLYAPKSDPTDSSAPFNLGSMLRAHARNIEAEA